VTHVKEEGACNQSVFPQGLRKKREKGEVPFYKHSQEKKKGKAIDRYLARYEKRKKKGGEKSSQFGFFYAH